MNVSPSPVTASAKTPDTPARGAGLAPVAADYTPAATSSHSKTRPWQQPGPAVARASLRAAAGRGRRLQSGATWAPVVQQIPAGMPAGLAARASECAHGAKGAGHVD